MTAPAAAFLEPHAQETPAPPVARQRLRDRPGLPQAGVALVALLVGLATMTPWLVGSYYDDGTYTVLAKSLATGHGYRYLNLPGTPVATHYPPGYPAFLAVLWRLWPVFPDNTALFKFANVVLLAVVALSVSVFARRVLRWPAWPSAAIALVGTLTPAMLVLSAALMSEMLFLALLVPTLLLAERLVRRGGDAKLALAVGACLGLTMLVRSIALPALGAAMLILALHRRWRDAALVAGAAALFIVPWALWTHHFDGALIPPLYSSYGSYGLWVRQALQDRGSGFGLEVLRTNLLAHAMYFGDRFMPVAGRIASQGAFAAFVLAALAGAWHLRRRAPVMLMFVFGYGAMLLGWAFQPDRFYYALEPFIALVLAAAGVRALRLWRERRPARRVASLILGSALLVLGAGFVRDAMLGISTRRWEREQRQRHESLAPLVAWVRKYTAPDAVIGVEADPMLYLYTGRRAHPLVTLRAAYYVEMPKADSPLLLGDTRELVNTYKPDVVLLRGTLLDHQSVVMETLRGLPDRIRPRARLQSGGAILDLSWSAPRADSLR